MEVVLLKLRHKTVRHYCSNGGEDKLLVKPIISNGRTVLQLSFLKFIYRFCVAAAIAYYLDKFEDYMRKNLAYELKKGEFNLLHQKFLIKLKKVKNFRELLKTKNIYLNKLKSVKVISKDERNKKIKIGIIGELFTSMEQFSSDNIERKLLILEKKLEESIKKEEYEKAGILKAEIKSLQQAQQ